MNIEEIREYCMVKKAVKESFPFNDTALVFKVMNKIFCLLALDKKQVSLKNTPEKNIELRMSYPAIIPGYHLNKQHWNTIDLDGTVPNALIQEMIDKSYQLILKSLPKKQQNEFLNL